MNRRRANRTKANRVRVQHHPTLTIDGRSVVVPSEPLHTSVWLQLPMGPRVWNDASHLVIDFYRGVRLIGVVAILVSLANVVLLAFAVSSDWGKQPQAVFGAVGSFLILIGSGLVILPARHEFDRAAGRYSRGSWISTVEMSQDAIVGVQVLSGIEVVERTQEEGDTYWRTHQLILVTHKKSLHREILFSGADEASITAVGSQLAEFLGVPLLMCSVRDR